MIYSFSLISTRKHKLKLLWGEKKSRRILAFYLSKTNLCKEQFVNKNPLINANQFNLIFNNQGDENLNKMIQRINGIKKKK